ncbi:MAG TPA: glycosyltransferase, partial [Terrimesophilobacter sp.]|nr:glycosyltransferase [Terrimesophilobacter sp.]
MTPRVTVVIPAYNEGDNIIPGLQRILGAVKSEAEFLVVVDSDDDTTIPAVNRLAEQHPTLRVSINDYGRGPANAIRYGIDAATAPTVVVTMADGCDDPRQIDDLVLLV